MPQDDVDGPNAPGSRWLIADIGGTNTRIAVYDGNRRALTRYKTCQTSDSVELASVFVNYVAGLPAGLRPTDACIAIAGPVSLREDDTAAPMRLTNARATLSIEALRRDLALSRLLVVNDFEAVARALPHIKPKNLQSIGPLLAGTSGNLAAIGPGTGLGIAGLLRDGSGWRTVASEAGHIHLPVCGEDELNLLRTYGSGDACVTAETFCSGPGLERLYGWLAERDGQVLQVRPSAREITDAALNRSDALSLPVVELFCRLLGSTAANVALTYGATAGIYIAGGFSARIAPLLVRSGFRARFEGHVASSYLARIPTWVVTCDDLGMIGAAYLLFDLLDDEERRPVSSPQRAVHTTRAAGL